MSADERSRGHATSLGQGYGGVLTEIALHQAIADLQTLGSEMQVLKPLRRGLYQCTEGEVVKQPL